MSFRAMRFWLLIAVVCVVCLSFAEMAAVKQAPMPAPKKGAPAPKKGDPKKAATPALAGGPGTQTGAKKARRY
ncbi:hypothetical protein TELCIR_07355 [Teladorsagia circumcincta]|uniref:Uncharacterized protein n=1 Tax=Teladorsagia circumcincta TaxID=45464 RepID=A0A2G9UKJ2_TELCI|nr:hypothetical protein TELCIR_07355 [Teladorsagia circumcincta]